MSHLLAHTRDHEPYLDRMGVVRAPRWAPVVRVQRTRWTLDKPPFVSVDRFRGPVSRLPICAHDALRQVREWRWARVP